MRHYDVVVVGGGIHGVGVAQAAAAAGHSVLLLEKSDLANGTSSRSSKLIHGGLRYLESAQWRLVRESLRERRILLDIAPELVHLVAFHLPVYRSTRRRPWQLRLGLTMYAALGGFDRTTRFGSLPRSEWHRLDGLETEGLGTVLRYCDGQTDDALLTRSVMASAQKLGAELALPATFVDAQLIDEGVDVRCTHRGRPEHLRARVLVNAAGPWANTVATRISPTAVLPAVELMQGTHLIVPGELAQGIYYVESPRDGRAVFVMPWYGQILIGTTETRYRGNPDQVAPLAAERHYLLSILRRYFPGLLHSAIAANHQAFAGLRVLPVGKGHAFHRSRETLLIADRNSRPRSVSIYGGKLTGWRATAEHVMHRIAGSLPDRKARADTTRLRIDPCPVPDRSAVQP
ncbi:MAG TPA: FAD-dependent oxidoreductase [Steroidobacteraceae bacterium]|nr:FAD-dependent oxidoreductase [Steroidobacteraceae bacterium]